MNDRKSVIKKQSDTDRKPSDKRQPGPGRKSATRQSKARPEAVTKKQPKTGNSAVHKGILKKLRWKPGNMVYPVPAVMVTVADKQGRDNIITVAWTGTVCTNPPMVYISVRPERYSYHMLRETGEFVMNLTTGDLAFATDYCGVKSGREVDKFRELQLTRQKAKEVIPPLIGESPVNIECRITECLPLGSHHMFLAEVVAVHVSEVYMDRRGAFHLEQAKPIVYSHGKYFDLNRVLGTFGYSIRKNIRKQ